MVSTNYMRIEIPSPVLNSLVEQAFGSLPRKALVVGGRKGIFSAHTIRQALNRISSGGLLELPDGEWDGFNLDKKAEIQASEETLPVITSTIDVTKKGFLYLRGATIRPKEGTPAIRILGGTLVCEDCEIYGSIESEGGDLYFENCLLNSRESTVICNGGTLEASACRIQGKVAGVLLQKDSTAKIYHSRIEACRTDGDGAPGAAIYGEASQLFVAATEFLANGVGIYLRDCPSATVANSLFLDNSHASLVSTSDTGHQIVITNCRMKGPQSQECARISIQGGSALIHNTDCQSSPAVALSARGTLLEVRDSNFESSELPAVEIDGGKVSWQRGEIRSLAARGLASWDASGEIKNVTIFGALPTPLDAENSLRLEDCVFLTPGTTTPEPRPLEKSLLEEVLESLTAIIGQREVKQEMTTLLRRASVDRQGGVAPELHGLVSGPKGCGKMMALGILAQGLVRLGAMRATGIRQITLADLKSGHLLEGDDWGLLFIRARVTAGLSLRSPGIAESLLHLCQEMPKGTSLLLEGDRDALDIFLKGHPILSRQINFELHFAPFSPPEMAEIFADKSRKDDVVLDHEAARKLPLLLHILQERMQKRFGDLQSIEDLYLSARRKENLHVPTAREGQAFVITPAHLETSVDKLVEKPASRSPAFAVICPSCGEENPWIPGLPKQTSCLHCEAPLGDQWGIWKDSTYFRKRRDTSHLARTGAVARRRIIRAGAEL